MADVPPEAIKLTRMIVRAFYPEQYAVIVDGVLRNNNFCSHSTLARGVLKMEPKELRQVLARMVNARLMRSDKRQQRRINYRDERKPSRIVTTEFWYVPLAELIDAFQYRVSIITDQLHQQIQKESEQDRYVCETCGHRYSLVEAVANVDPETGQFICDKMGFHRMPCGGVISEEDNSSKLKEVESFKALFEEELRPLRALALECSTMKIPSHPLEGADDETWAQYVPETIGVHGEVVDEEGLTSEIAAELDGKPEPDKTGVTLADLGTGEAAVSAGVIPEKPDWFKDSKKADDADDDMDDDTGVFYNNNSLGTGAVMQGGEIDTQAYVRKMLGLPEDEPSTKAPEEKTQVEGEEISTTAEETHDSTAPSNGKAEDAASEDAKTTAAAEPSEPEVYVEVKGERYALSEVTDALIEQMTDDEYKRTYPPRASHCVTAGRSFDQIVAMNATERITDTMVLLILFLFSVFSPFSIRLC